MMLIPSYHACTPCSKPILFLPLKYSRDPGRVWFIDFPLLLLLPYVAVASPVASVEDVRRPLRAFRCSRDRRPPVVVVTHESRPPLPAGDSPRRRPPVVMATASAVAAADARLR
jgi:hypothetical protein